MVLKNFITPRNDFINCGLSVAEIILVMNERAINYIVLLQEGKPCGIITERDILRLLSQKNYKMKAAACTICSRKIIKTKGNRTIEYALGLMVDERLRRIVVVDDDNKYLGVIEQEEIIYQFESEVFSTSAKLEDFLHIASKALVLEPNVTIEDAIEIMNFRNIGSVLVGEKGIPEGIVTESDILHNAQNPNLDKLLLKNLMQIPLIFFEASETVEKTLSVMQKENIRRIAIHNERNNSYFVMTTRDVLRNLQGSYSNFLEKKLQASRTAYNQMNELLVEVIDLGNLYVVGWANECAKKELGISVDDSIEKYLPPTLWKETIKAFDLGSKNVEEYINIGKKTYRFSASFSFTSGCKIIKLLFSDISEIHQLNLKLSEQVSLIENSLAERQRLYEETFHQKTIGIGYISKTGKILDVNPYLVQLLGYAKKELVGKNIVDISHKDEMEKSIGIWQRLVDKKNIDKEKFEKRYRKKDGTWIWVEVSLSAHWERSGELKHIVGFVQDITEHHKARETLVNQQELLSTVMNSVADLIFYKDNDSRYIGGNDSWFKYTGLSQEEIFGKTDYDIHSPSDAKRFTQADSEVFSAQKRLMATERVENRDGSVSIFEVHKSPLINQNNETVGLVGIVHDVTEKHKQEKHQRLAQSVFENTAEGIIVTDKNQIITSVNPAFSKITGYLPEDAIGKHPAMLSSGKHKNEFYENMWASITERGSWQGEIWNRRKNNELYPELLTISEVKDKNGEVINYIGTFTDITSIKHTQQKLEFIAHHDPLTKLPNRLLLEARLGHAIEWAKRDKFKIAVLFLDLDHFKDINDAFGHSAGDEILVEVANRFRNLLREKDTIARVGGDEFVVVVEDFEDLIELEEVIHKILNVFKKSFLVKNQIFNTACSIGIALYPNDGQDIETLIKNADAAMYKAKELGRNTYSFYTTEITHALFEKIHLENEIRGAIELKEFILYYQPQIDMRTGKIVGVEALARWNHPKKGIISPDKFIPLSELTKLIVPIGRQLLEIACFQAKKWIEMGKCQKGWKMAINISAVQMQNDNLFEAILNATNTAKLDPSYLELELTETYIMKNPKESIRLMRKLKTLGVTLAIDDFGVGYSSLSYLKQFPIDRLKVDRSFIQDIPTDSDDVAITKAILALGRSLELEVLAEGVENLVQKEFLIKEGCYLAQGYYYTKPLPPEDLEKGNLSFVW